jgi:hypothetical protein
MVHLDFAEIANFVVAAVRMVESVEEVGMVAVKMVVLMLVYN